MASSFKLSRSMRKKFINKRYAVVENSLIADEDNNDIDETPMDIVLNDESTEFGIRYNVPNTGRY